MNSSKKNDLRFWAKWLKSGAVKSRSLKMPLTDVTPTANGVDTDGWSISSVARGAMITFLETWEDFISYAGSMSGVTNIHALRSAESSRAKGCLEVAVLDFAVNPLIPMSSKPWGRAFTTHSLPKLAVKAMLEKHAT